MYPMKKEPTARQRSILDYISGFIRENGYPPSLREICARFGIRSPKNARKHLEALEKKGFLKRAANASRAIGIPGLAVMDAVAVPIAGSVKAGAPSLAVEDIVGYVTLDSRFFKCAGAFLLKADGESMSGAGISNGDYLVVSPAAHAADNDIVVALIDDEATVKRFTREGDVIILKPENPAFEPIRVREGERELRIIGKVASIIKHVGASGGAGLYADRNK